MPTPQELLEESKCYACYASSSDMAQLLKLGILSTILKTLDPMADTSPQSILSEASCYQCYAGNPLAMQLLELGMLKLIYDNGTTGGGTLQTYTGHYPDPNGNVTPANPAYAAIYYQVPSDTVYNVWFWDPSISQWNQFSSPS